MLNFTICALLLAAAPSSLVRHENLHQPVSPHPKGPLRPVSLAPGPVKHEGPVYPVPPTDTTGGRTTQTSFTEASSEASHWLTLIDQKQFQGAWDDSGPLLKDVIGPAQWDAALSGTRTRLGNVLSRKLTTHQSLSALPHGTRGNFIIIEYQTQFSWNIRGTETVTMMTNERGQWRVIGYSLKRS